MEIREMQTKVDNLEEAGADAYFEIGKMELREMQTKVDNLEEEGTDAYLRGDYNLSIHLLTQALDRRISGILYY
jgi:hypothetical protein